MGKREEGRKREKKEGRKGGRKGERKEGRNREGRRGGRVHRFGILEYSVILYRWKNSIIVHHVCSNTRLLVQKKERKAILRFDLTATKHIKTVLYAFYVSV